MTKPQQTKRRRPGIILLILLAIFVIPLLAAWLLYQQGGIYSAKSNNYGHLITPPFSVKQFQFSAQAQKMLQGRWVMMLFHPTPCQRACQKNLYDLRQIRTATGKDRNRIERALIIYRNSRDGDTAAWLDRNFPGMLLLDVNAKHWQRVINKHIDISDADKPGAIYLVDPHGNVMMVYKPYSEPNHIYKDLKQLLRVSQIG